jgi:prepilin-type N-terminal cleavage/methylation domain-containing protein
MRKTSGFTMVELLIALAILATVIAVVSLTISTTLSAHRTSEDITSSQAKLRRVTEVFSQELREAVLGGISNQPYASSSTSISFSLLDGGAGYTVLPHDSGNNNSFKNAANVKIVAPVTDDEELELEGGQALMVNASGDAIIFNVDNTQKVGGANSVEVNVVHPGCANTIDYTANTLLFKVRTIGYDYDSDSKTLFAQEGNSAARPMAFNLGTFQIDYVYVESDGTPVVRSTPLVDDDDAPIREGVIDGSSVTLKRLQLVLGTEKGNGFAERTYTSQVDLSGDQSFNIQKVITCD